jgi:acyl dehydratase
VIDPATEGSTLEPYSRDWSSTDTILYALGVGCGAEDLAYTTENSHSIEQQALPTFGVIIALPGRVLRTIGSSDWGKLVHARQRLHLAQPLQPAGTALVTERVASIGDKGEGGHAVIVTESTATDARDGSPLLTCEMTVVLRGQGGFGGHRGQSAPRPQIPEREPDRQVAMHTRSDQALLYRLSGDRNPLHSDPWFATHKAGFPEPILHGLCTYGFAARAATDFACDGEVAAVASIDATFSAPVYPGDALTVSLWRVDAGATRFRVSAGEEQRLVLDAGELLTR